MQTKKAALKISLPLFALNLKEVAKDVLKFYAIYFAFSIIVGLVFWMSLHLLTMESSALWEQLSENDIYEESYFFDIKKFIVQLFYYLPFIKSLIILLSSMLIFLRLPPKSYTHMITSSFLILFIGTWGFLLLPLYETVYSYLLVLGTLSLSWLLSLAWDQHKAKHHQKVS